MEHVGIGSRLTKDKRKHWSLLYFVSWIWGLRFGRLGVLVEVQFKGGHCGIRGAFWSLPFCALPCVREVSISGPGSESDCTFPASLTTPRHSPRYSPPLNLLLPQNLSRRCVVGSWGENGKLSELSRRTW